MAREDKEWPAAAKNALLKLCGMYDDSNNARIDKSVQNAKLVKELSDEKNKIDKKYYILIEDVNKFMDETEKRLSTRTIAEFRKRLQRLIKSW